MKGESMSEHQETPAYGAEEQTAPVEQMSAFIAEGQTDKRPTHNLKDVAMALDHQSYPLGEVPQDFLMDPQGFLPLNSDRLIGQVNMIEKLTAEANALIQGEIDQIQKLHKKITFWEDKIEKNKIVIEKNRSRIQQNTVDIVYDRKNRDYWWGRSELVALDYKNAEAASRPEAWGWLIKKWGLKNADGVAIDSANDSVEELCNGEANNLSSEYRSVGNRYEQAKKDKEAESYRLIHENSKYLASNETLQGYISFAYSNEIEPYQDGVLLLKELTVKLKALAQNGEMATYGELRNWAENFLNDFLKSNPRVHLPVETEFRKLTSIPLPAENC